MVTVFGLKTCDTCRKARRALETAGLDVVFVDLRETPVDPGVLAQWQDALGPKLLNMRSTTWRGLSEEARAADPLNLMETHPTLIKRPVIDHDGTLYLGWGKDVQAALI